MLEAGRRYNSQDPTKAARSPKLPAEQISSLYLGRLASISRRASKTKAVHPGDDRRDAGRPQGTSLRISQKRDGGFAS
jgi:hypothetical protein